MEQLDLFAVVTDAYCQSSSKPLSNAELYQVIAKKTDLNLSEKAPIGQKGEYHSPLKRKVRWFQQTLKQMGIIERVEGERGIWQLTERQGKKLHKAASGVKLVAFSTELGVAIWGSNRDIFTGQNEPIALCISSLPYPLRVARQYGNPDQRVYTDFILRSLEPFVRSLLPGGSIVLNLGNDIFEQGSPSRSIYLERLIIALHDELGLKLMDRTQWVNYSKPPSPTYWACVNRYQLSAAYEPIYWFTNDPSKVRSDNRRVLEPHTPEQIKLMANGGANRSAVYGDGAYRLREHSFGNVTSGKIPRNVMEKGHVCADSKAFRAAAKELNLPCHGAMFPSTIPEFWIKFLTEPGELVVGPFSGSGKVGLKADQLGRRWIISEWILEYIRVSAELFRNRPGFELNPAFNFR